MTWQPSHPVVFHILCHSFRFRTVGVLTFNHIVDWHYSLLSNQAPNICEELYTQASFYMASRWYPYTTSHSYLPRFNTVIREWNVFKRVAVFIHSAQEPPYTAHCGRIRPYSLGAKPNVCCSSYSPITGLVSCQIVAAKAANAIPLHPFT